MVPLCGLCGLRSTRMYGGSSSSCGATLTLLSYVPSVTVASKVAEIAPPIWDDTVTATRPPPTIRQTPMVTIRCRAGTIADLSCLENGDGGFQSIGKTPNR